MIELICLMIGISVIWLEIGVLKDVHTIKKIKRQRMEERLDRYLHGVSFVVEKTL